MKNAISIILPTLLLVGCDVDAGTSTLEPAWSVYTTVSDVFGTTHHLKSQQTNGDYFEFTCNQSTPNLYMNRIKLSGMEFLSGNGGVTWLSGVYVGSAYFDVTTANIDNGGMINVTKLNQEEFMRLVPHKLAAGKDVLFQHSSSALKVNAKGYVEYGAQFKAKCSSMWGK